MQHHINRGHLHFSTDLFSRLVAVAFCLVCSAVWRGFVWVVTAMVNAVLLATGILEVVYLAALIN